MLFSKTYNEIKLPGIGMYKSKGSKFISYSFPVYSTEEIKVKIIEVKRIEKNANHYCYAYILNPDCSAKKFNDDGEPSSTAGIPILRQIENYELTNIIIIVVRYFGGVKLGISGLIKSYRLAARDAINNSFIVEKIIKEQYLIEFQYSDINNIMRLVKKFNLDIINTDFEIDCSLIFAVERSQADQIISLMKENYNINITYLKTV